MPVITAATGAATAAGISLASIANMIEADTGEAVASGIPAFLLRPTATTVADQVRVSVYDATGTNFIAHLPRRRGVRWMEEMNTPGSGSVTLRLDDPVLTAHWSIVNDEFNIVRVSVGTRLVKAWIVESKTVEEDPETGDRWITLAGRGVLALLDNAVIFPEYPLRKDTADARSFDYGSKDGPWKIDNQWKTPAGIPQASAASARKGLPKGWPDKKCEWIWSSSPNKKSPNGDNYFRGSFNLAAQTRVRIWAVGDDRMELQLDGEVILRHANNRWRKPKAVTMTLAAGAHLIAAKVTNTPRGTDDKSGFLCLVAQVNSNDKIVKVIKRSRPATFNVRGYYPNAPGWYPAQVLKALVVEAQARSVASFSGISLGFSDTHSTDGRHWLARIDQSYPVGTSSLLDTLAPLSEHGLDVAMTPGLVLQAWEGRGVDRRNWVRLVHTRGTSGERRQGDSDGERRPKLGTSVGSKIKNQGLIRFVDGWGEGSAPTGTHGRREMGLVLGGAGSESLALAQAGNWFRDTSTPEVTVTVTTTSVKGPQPFVDYDIYDVITAPNLFGIMAPHRVLSISAGEDDETGAIEWVHELYPEV